MKGDEIRIVLADNRASNRRGLKALLAFESRIEILGEASDGKEAVELIDKTPTDLILMDIHMPVMDGLEATQIIKTVHPDVRVVLYSVFPGYEQEAILAGADCFLVKGSPDSNPSEIILSFFPSKDPGSV